MSEHLCTSIYETDMLDAVKCSCGWQSKWYYDGEHYAYGEWKRHVKETNAVSVTAREGQS